MIVKISATSSQKASLVEENEIVRQLYQQMTASDFHDLSMGEIENLVDRHTREIRRQLVEMLTQDMADETILGCPDCGHMLKVTAHRRERTVNATVGPIRFERSYGRCERCQKQVYPADVALGLHARAKGSPRVQEICALTALRAPAAQAQDDVRRMCGLDIGASTLHREAKRQGERAIQLRAQAVAMAEHPDGADRLAAQAPKLPPHSTMVIEIDAWNIRERDYWGQTKKRRDAGEEVGRWHWVYTGTVFRLDHRGTSENGRHFVIDRGYVATRAGLDAFRKQLHAEALQRGLRQAETVLILGDGAVWIWNLAANQFGKAQQRVDLYHVKQHLWTLAAELHGKNTEEAEEWVRPYLRWLERRKNGALDVITDLEQLLETLADTEEKKREALSKEIGYMQTHKERMDYKSAKALGQPCGSGAIESTCSQYQRRFKLTGQFWSLEGDEAFLALATLHRNERWHLLFPHDKSTETGYAGPSP